MGKLSKIHDSDLEATGSFNNKKKEAYRQAKSLLSDTELLDTDPQMILIEKLNSRVSDLVDESNTNDDKITFPGFGTSNGTALRGDTTTISNAQAAAIVLNTAKTGITTAQTTQLTNLGKTTIGGISLSATKTLTPMTHMGLNNYVRVLPHQFNNANLTYQVSAQQRGTSGWVNAGAKTITAYTTVQIPVGAQLQSVTPYGDNAKSTISLRGLNLNGTYSTDPLEFEHVKSGFAGSDMPHGGLGFALPVEYLASGKSKVYESTSQDFLLVKLVLLTDSMFTGIMLNYAY